MRFIILLLLMIFMFTATAWDCGLTYDWQGYYTEHVQRLSNEELISEYHIQNRWFKRYAEGRRCITRRCHHAVLWYEFLYWEMENRGFEV